MRTMPTPLAPNLAHAYTERARKHKDGSVLLSTVDDRICKLNGVGALTWMILEEAGTSLAANEVVRQLQVQFDAINSEGELRYEVSSEQLQADTTRFLNKLVSMNLLKIEHDKHGQESYQIGENVSGTTSATANESVIARKTDESSIPADENTKISKRETLSAFMGLLAFDLLLRIAGFRSLIEKVKHWPIAEPRSTDLKICRRVRAMVDRAQMYYPKKAMCLQHSAVVTCLLRRRGVPAELVVAAQEFPIRVHAWSEVQGYVVNDYQSVKSKHHEMKRV